MPSRPSKKDTPASDPNHNYTPGDIILGKLKGYPAWPGQVVDAGDAPVKVQKEKPPKAKNTHLVQFFPTGDFAWLPARDLSVLTPREIESYVSSSNKKKGELLQGYKVAQDPAQWRTERADALAEWEALQQQSMLAQDEEDQLASDGGEGAKGAAKDKKRKRASGAQGANGADKKKNSKAAKKDEAGPAPKKAKTTTSDDPAETVKSWRHKLQKVFLGKGELAAEEMPKCAEYFDAMENFDMKKEWLVESKLAKVLKRIALMKDGQIPDEDKYSFRERSSALANKWSSLLGGSNESPAPASGAAAAKADDAAAAPAKADDAEPKAEGDAKADEPAPAGAPADEDKKDAPAAGDADVAMEDAAPNGDDKKADAPAPAGETKEGAAPAEAPAEASA